MLDKIKFTSYTKNHNYELVETFSIEDGLLRLAEMISSKKSKNNRKTFLYNQVLNNNTKCVCCGMNGVKFCNGFNPNDKSYHFDLYAEDDTMLTIDHINPVSISKDNSLENTQILCNICNGIKGTSIEKYNLHKALINNFQQIETSLYNTLKDYIAEACVKDTAYIYIKLI